MNLPGDVVKRISGMPGLTKLISRGVKPRYAAVLDRPDTRFASLDLRLRLVAGGVEVSSVVLVGEDFGATASGFVSRTRDADIRGEVILSQRFSSDVAADVKEARLLFDADNRIALPFIYRGAIGAARPEPDVERLATSVLRGRAHDVVGVVQEGSEEGGGALDSLGRKPSDLLRR